MTKEFSNTSMRRLDQMMIEVDTLSEHYNEFTNDFRKKQDQRWKLLTDRHYKTEFYSPVKFELSALINSVDYIHKDRINFKVERQYMNKMLHTRITFLLDTIPNVYMTEIEIAEKKFTKRVTDYYNDIYKGMFSMPREIHRCELQVPKRGENFLELTHTHQIWLITSGHLMADENLYRLNCYKRCEEIDTKPIGFVTDLQINDCETLSLAKFMKSCPA
ncbi:hypothetical protein PV325_011775, partial [Microctonus aethiopoides]